MRLTRRHDNTSLVKVLDFGISKSTAGSDFAATRSQAVMGTPAYMSPEQTRSAKFVDARTDVWALGVILYQLVIGHVPWDAETLTELCYKISVLPANQLPALAVRRDGVVVPSEAFGTPLPVDPGSYTIHASATGHLTWSMRIDANKPGAVITVEVPRLVAVPANTEPDPQHRRHVLGLGIGGGGAALVGLAVVFGLEARSKWGSVGTHCDANRLCDAQGVSINHDARVFGNAGTIVGGLGLAALITGAVLYITAPVARPVIEHAPLVVYENSHVQIGLGGHF